MEIHALLAKGAPHPPRWLAEVLAGDFADFMRLNHPDLVAEWLNMPFLHAFDEFVLQRRPEAVQAWRASFARRAQRLLDR